MKVGRLNFIYLLIAIAIIMSTVLQIIWLEQLYKKQRIQIFNELEHLVRSSAQANVYKVLAVGRTSLREKTRIKNLFLSPQWEQLYLAAGNMKSVKGLTWYHGIKIRHDSIHLRLDFTVTDHIQKPKTPVSVYTSPTDIDVKTNDSLSLISMKASVVKKLQMAGISSPAYFRIYRHGTSKIISSDAPAAVGRAYVSKRYSFNLEQNYDYQLLVTDIFSLVVYQLRFYLFSSVLMLFLICAAFYALVRLQLQQRLFATAKLNFTSNMTHELKTPIASISVALQAIKKFSLFNDPSTLQNYLDISETELQRLNMMIEKVLHLDQTDDPGPLLTYQLFEVQAGLEQVIDTMRLQLTNPADVIFLKPSAEPCFILGDTVFLTNIFSTLIENAIKYSRGALMLEIDCTLQRGKVIISFKDNGPGIEKMYQKKVFDRFFRVPARGDVHDVKGFGLGLHYVKEMVKQHGGDISLKSDAGKGCIFTVTLPSADQLVTYTS